MTTYTLYNKRPEPIKIEPIKIIPDRIVDSPKIDFSGGNLFSKYSVSSHLCPLCGDSAVISCNCGHYIDKHGHTFTADGKEAYEKHPGTTTRPDNYLNTRYNGRECNFLFLK